jgi:hypothetical protein
MLQPGSGLVTNENHHGEMLYGIVEGHVLHLPTCTCIAGRSQVVKSFKLIIVPSTSGAFFLSFISISSNVVEKRSRYHLLSNRRRTPDQLHPIDF